MTGNAAQVLELARQLSPREQLELIQTLAALARETLEAQTEPAPEAVPDPILELVGAYAHELPLIDDIAPSADPDLYLAAEALGPQAEGMHAWDIAPARYGRGPDVYNDKAWSYVDCSVLAVARRLAIQGSKEELGLPDDSDERIDDATRRLGA